MSAPVAVVDLGTISARLLITDGADEYRDVTVTRLGADLDRTHQLSIVGLAATEEILGSYRQEIVAGGVDPDRIRVVATAAARAATNTDALAEVVARSLDAELEVLDEADEGEAAFAGATAGLRRTPGFDERGVFLTVDIGGGSTEFAIGTIDGVDHVHSVDIGASRITDAYLHADPPGAAELSAALSVIELHLDDVRRELPGLSDALSGGGRVLGVGGTFTTMAAIEIGLIDYDRAVVDGFELTREAAEDVFRTVATEASDDRRHNPGLHPDRVDLIVGGACVAVETMRQFDLDAVRISESDLLDGLAAELLRR